MCRIRLVVLFAALFAMVPALPAPEDAPQVSRLIKQLGSDDFEEREAASKQLDGMGESALDALRKAAESDTDAEVRRRAAELIAGIEQRLYGEQQHLAGHTNEVWAIAVTPDGKRLLSAGYDATARIWDVDRGTELVRFTSHSENISAAVLSADGKLALSGSGNMAGMGDFSARLWDTTSGKELGKFLGHRERVLGVAFLPGNRQVLTGSGDRTLYLWDVATGEKLRQFEGHRERDRRITGRRAGAVGELRQQCSLVGPVYGRRVTDA
jgi:hypothetical protein